LHLLGDYIKEHFADEEKLQQKHNYPLYDWHKRQHKIYIQAYEKLHKEYMKNGPSQDFTLHLTQNIIDWIVKHIQHADVDLGKFVNCMEESHNYELCSQGLDSIQIVYTGA